jgi:hypothetical protein
MSDLDLSCKICQSEVTVPMEWVKTNGHAFCNTCCKSFPVSIKEASKLDMLRAYMNAQQEESDEETAPPVEEKEEVVAKSTNDDTTEYLTGLDEGYYHFKLTEL